MSPQERRKFSLGDIVRKLNEGKNVPADSEPRPADVHRSEPAPLRPDDGERRSPEAGALPPQPQIGRPQHLQDVHPPQQRHIPQPFRQQHAGPVAPASVEPLPETGMAATAVMEKAGASPAPREGAATQENKAETGAAPLQGLSSASGEDEQAFDLFRYLSVIIRRRVPILVVTVIAAIYSIMSYMSGTKLYTARTRLLYKPAQMAILDQNQVMWGSWIDRDKAINTHLELLRSKAVLDRVADNMGRPISPEAIAGSLRVTQGGATDNKNDIIEISFSNPRPELARDVVNDLANIYIQFRREVDEQEKTRFLYSLQTQIDRFQKELDMKEDALRVFKETNRMAEMTSETNLTVQKLTNMELAQQTAELELAETEKRYAATKGQINVQESRVMHSLQFNNAYSERLAELDMQLATISAEYSPGHFKVRMVKQQIDSIQSAMKSDIQNQVTRQTMLSKDQFRVTLIQDLARLSIEKAVLETKVASQKLAITGLDSALQKLPAMTQQYLNLQRQTESLEQTLRMLKQKYEEAKIIRDSQESDLKVLELAVTPTIAVSSRKSSSIMIGILVGLILGIALAFLIEYLDQSIKGPSDVEKLLEMPLIGFVPLIETDKALIENSEKLAKSVIEPFRAVRANLKHLTAKHESKVHMVCSAVKGEGKTTLGANLAITFAVDGKTVVLVDADLRRPQIHKLFNTAKDNGVADYLQGIAGVDAIVKKTKYENLSIITSGAQPDNPAELVGTTKFDDLIKDLRDRFDLVLFDSPALLAVSDVITMAPKMDGIIMVVRTFWTPVKAAKQARNQLKRIGCKIFGAILNGVSHSRGYYPYYYGYYGYYSYRYSYEYDKDPRRAWSMREFGLLAENKIKEGLQNARLYVPHYIALGGSFLRYMSRRMLFWALLAALVAMAFLEVKFRPSKDDDAGGVRYLEPATAVPQSLRAPDATGGSVIPLENAGGVSAGDASADSMMGSAVVHQPDSLFALTDSILQWSAAFNQRNAPLYLRFYNQEQFTSPTGTFDQWKRDIQGIFSSGPQNTILIVDSVRIDAVRLPFCRAMVYTAAISSADTARSVVTMIWKRTSDVWRIVRQKEGG